MTCDSVGVDHGYDLSGKGSEWLDDIPRMSKAVRFFNYLGDSRFEADDFFNGNHLTSDGGAAKFTEILKEDIEMIDVKDL